MLLWCQILHILPLLGALRQTGLRLPTPTMEADIKNLNRSRRKCAGTVSVHPGDRGWRGYSALLYCHWYHLQGYLQL